MLFFPVTLLTDVSYKLCLLVRGDAFPVANDSWTQVSVTVLNHGALARTMAHTWILGVAWCADKDFELLRKLFSPLFEVSPPIN